jgi:hypothetical protein
MGNQDIFYIYWVYPKFNVIYRKILDKNNWIAKQRLKTIDHQRTNKVDYHFENHLSKAMAYAIILISLVCVMYYFQHKGHKAASKILETIKSKAHKDNELITVKIDGKPEKLIHLMCGARNCAGIDPKTNVVYYFPQNGHSYHLRDLKD